MRLAALLAVALAFGACGGDDDEAGLPPTTAFHPETTSTTVAETPPTVPPDTERPALVGADAIGYVLDNGLVLWVEPPVGRIVAGDGDCDALVGDPDDFYDRYNADTIPGFEGLVCNPE